jgi:hypothetical protein
MLLGTSTNEYEDDLIRELVETTDLGGGLRRVVTAWKGRENRNGPFELLGLCDGFELDLGDSREPLELELDRNHQEWKRTCHLLWPDGQIDAANSARRLVELARLLRRDEVFAALQEWAAEDAASDLAEAQRAAERAEQQRNEAA